MQGKTSHLPNVQDFKQIPATRDKMQNYGGSPPILGLKEATPELGETRHKWLHTTHSHNIHDHNIITKHYTIDYKTTQPKACTKIQQLNQVIG